MILAKRRTKLLNGIILIEKIVKCYYKCSDKLKYYYVVEIKNGIETNYYQDYLITEKVVERLIKEMK